MPRWIKWQKKTFNPTQHAELRTATIGKASAEQRFVYSVLKDHFESCLAGNQKEPLRLIVPGVAGTGNSYIIDVLAILRGKHAKLCPYTGAAACLIKGTTIHYLFKLPTRESMRSVTSRKCGQNGSKIPSDVILSLMKCLC